MRKMLPSEGLAEFRINSADESAFLALRAFPWQDEGDAFEGPDVQIELARPGLWAEAVVPAYAMSVAGLGALFRELDRDWRGWEGAKVSGTHTGKSWFSLSASHDGAGHVTLDVGLVSEWPFYVQWTAHAKLRIDIGSVAELARAFDRWAQIVWPPSRRMTIG